MYLFLVVLAITVPDIGLIISLLGAVAGSFLSIIYPPIIDSVLFWNQDIWKHIKNMCIVQLGLLGFLTGTYISMNDIVQTFDTQ